MGQLSNVSALNKNAVLGPFGKSTIIPIQYKFDLIVQPILFQYPLGKIIPGHGLFVRNMIGPERFIASDYFLKNELGQGFSIGGGSQLGVRNVEVLPFLGFFYNGPIKVMAVLFTV